MSYFQTFIDHLPSSLNKAGVNIQKVARFITEPLDDVSFLYKQIDDYRSIDKAAGAALDKLGAKYGQERGQADDEFYRLMIKSKIIVRHGDVTYDGVLRAIQSSLHADPTGIQLQTLRPGPKDDGEPLALKVENIPLSIAPNAWEQQYLISRVRKSVAAGVRVADINFTVAAPFHMYLGVVARADRTMFSRSDLLDDRTAVSGPAAYLSWENMARFNRTMVAENDLLTNREQVAQLTDYIGTTQQQTVVMTTDAIQPFTPPKNLFNMDAVVRKALNADGTVTVDNQVAFTSDFIPVSGMSDLTVQEWRTPDLPTMAYDYMWTAFYDQNKKFIAGSYDQHGGSTKLADATPIHRAVHVTVPTGAAFIRVGVPELYVMDARVMVNKGTIAPDWVPYQTAGIATNLLAKSKATQANLTSSGTVSVSSSGKLLSDYISVQGLTSLTLQDWKQSPSSRNQWNYLHWQFYDASKTKLGSLITVSSQTIYANQGVYDLQTINVPANAAYIRIDSSWAYSSTAKVMLEAGSTPHSFVPAIEDKQ